MKKYGIYGANITNFEIKIIQWFSGVAGAHVSLKN